MAKVIPEAEKKLNKEISERIDRYMSENGISNKALVDACEKKGFDISESQIRKYRKYHNDGVFFQITAYWLRVISEGLGINIECLMGIEQNPNGEASKSMKSYSQDSGLISNAKYHYFQPYMGTYHVYFFPTKSDETQIMHGVLTLKCGEDPFSPNCTAILEIEAGMREPKCYEGEMFISIDTQCCYIELFNRELSEKSYISFRYQALWKNEMKCRLALALTTCAGTDRRPTVQRMFITQTEIRKDTEEYNWLYSQLLMNDKRIIISEDSFTEVMNRYSEEQREYIKKHLSGSSYYLFYETMLNDMDLKLEDDEKRKLICSLREKSIMSKYNKIGSKPDDMLYRLIYYQNPGNNEEAPSKGKNAT